MKVNYPSIFNDVIGPVMRGPSSSHCAASLRIGRMARDLMEGDLKEILIEFDPRGSLATTHHSQGSDMGLFGGFLGWEAYDERLKHYQKAVQDADVVYAKSWGPLLVTDDPEDGKKIQDQYKHWIADAELMSKAKDDAVYMHPLPADRDIEVTSEVMDGPNSVVFDEAENRLHAQKAVMALTMRS